jgi:ferredoxin
MEIRIRRGRCCGSAQCAEALPQVFALDAAGKAIVLDTDGASFELLLDAAESCPSEAIELEDDEGARFP